MLVWIQKFKITFEGGFDFFIWKLTLKCYRYLGDLFAKKYQFIKFFFFCVFSFLKRFYTWNLNEFLFCRKWRKASCQIEEISFVKMLLISLQSPIELQQKHLRSASKGHVTCIMRNSINLEFLTKLVISNMEFCFAGWGTLQR